MPFLETLVCGKRWLALKLVCWLILWLAMETGSALHTVEALLHTLHEGFGEAFSGLSRDLAMNMVSSCPSSWLLVEKTKEHKITQMRTTFHKRILSGNSSAKTTSTSFIIVVLFHFCVAAFLLLPARIPPRPVPPPPFCPVARSSPAGGARFYDKVAVVYHSIEHKDA